MMILLGIFLIGVGTYVMHLGNTGKSDDKIRELESKLNEKDAKIEEQAKLIRDSITGGTSFPFLMFKRHGVKNAIQVVAYGVGDHVLTNVEFTIIDQGKRAEEAEQDLNNKNIHERDHIYRSIKNLEKHMKTYKLGNLAPNDSNVLMYGKHLTLIEPDTNETIEWEIHITSSNGFYMQKFKSVPRTENHRSNATEVWDQNGKTVWKLIPETWSKDKPWSQGWY